MTSARGRTARKPDRTDEADAPPLHAGVYRELRQRLITGKLAPGTPLSTRGLALQLGVSQMPVRDALSRLAAEGAIDIRSKRRIMVPSLTAERLDEVLRCRLLLEPEAAANALPRIDADALAKLRAIDAALDAALGRGDINGYMENNYRFHFALYRAGGETILSRMIETLWLQFGPMMREVYGRVGAVHLDDQHVRAIEAIESGDAARLRDAIAGDIGDGMTLFARELGAEA